MTALYLTLAIGFEVAWAVAMKLSDGLRRPAPTVVMLIAYLLSLLFLSLATRRLDVGVGYAIWAGSGAAIIAVIGALYFREPVTALKVGSLALIVAGIVGLELSRRPS
ncbi:Quaternary ammonium compound-resistance protein SugE [Phycisphaerae bacterium RAS1]|nr:Quaternary ammonium compound-resistance protein SugE [Phycisphaerae bacterium RAS1]